MQLIKEKVKDPRETDEEQSQTEKVLKQINTLTGKKAAWQPSSSSAATQHETANLWTAMHLVSEEQTVVGITSDSQKEAPGWFWNLESNNTNAFTWQDQEELWELLCWVGFHMHFFLGKSRFMDVVEISLGLYKLCA